ncbi:hypothetical protein [Haliscomenobacter sp.]|uniref:hypothetical protein n=1 Tax=Haliscomenobacter sp. TaxID=2717303 RepID=UPI003BA92824
MKKASIWILLLVYLTASCVELLPVLKDTLAHLFWHHHHLEHVHHGDEDHTHVAEEIVQLLNLDHGATTAISESPDYKFTLSLHLIAPTIVFKTRRLGCIQQVPIPLYSFSWSLGVGNAVFQPPELA